MPKVERESAAPPKPRTQSAVFDNMCWPIPDAEASWRLRYDRAVRDDEVQACREMDAYAHLLVMPIKRRNYVIAQIKKQMNEGVSDAG
jgi:hypothetical protein